MKILHLSGASPQPWGVELHPRLTVVHGLDPAVAGAVAAAVDAVVRGRAELPSGVTGRVQVDGVVHDLADAMAATPGPVPAPPFGAADLVDDGIASGHAHALDADVARAEVALVEAEKELAAALRDQRVHRPRSSQAARWRERATAASALRHARLRVADAITADALAAAARPTPTGPPEPAPEVVALAGERIASARRALDAAVAARDEAEAEREQLEVASGVDGDVLRAELADVEHRCIVMAPAAPPAETDRRALEQRRAFLAGELSALAAQPSVQVADALAAAEAHGGIDEFEAGRVAVEWERVRDLVAEADAAPPPQPQPLPATSVTMSETSASRLARAHEDVSNARRTLAEATGASPLDTADVEALEAAHAEVLAAWEGSEKRIGVGKARRRLEDAQLAEREILARMGFASYTEFMVSGRASGTGSMLDAEEARRAVLAAEDRLSALEAHIEKELTEARADEAATAAAWAESDAGAARGRLTATLAALRSRAVDLLGRDPGDDVAGALRERISTDPLHDLRLALEEVGVPLGQVMSREAVLARARDWIVQAESQAARRGELIAAQAEVDGQIAALEAAEGARVAWEAMVARRDDLRAQIDRVAEAAAVAEAAEERLVRDRADVDRAEAALAEARAEADRAIAAATPMPRQRTEPVAVPTPVGELSTLEAEARDAQTALDVAVAHLLPPRVDDDDVDLALGRAEARVALARLERDTLVALRADRRAQDVDDAPDADAVTWRILSRLARQSAEAPEGGPGPLPLVLDEPFGALQGADVAVVCDALVGPAATVQVILITEREDVAAWARGCASDEVGPALPSIVGASPRD